MSTQISAGLALAPGLILHPVSVISMAAFKSWLLRILLSDIFDGGEVSCSINHFLHSFKTGFKIYMTPGAVRVYDR